MYKMTTTKIYGVKVFLVNSIIIFFVETKRKSFILLSTITGTYIVVAGAITINIGIISVCDSISVGLSYHIIVSVGVGCCVGHTLSLGDGGIVLKNKKFNIL